MEVISVSSENFEETVLKSDVPVLADFWAPWCGPCRMLSPNVEAAAAEGEGFKAVKINTDEELELALRYRISAIPCLIVFKGGEEAARSVGYISKEEVLELVKKV